MPYASNKFSTLTLVALFILTTFTLASGPPEKRVSASIDADTPTSARRSVKTGQVNTTVLAVIDRVNAAEKTATLQSVEGLTIELDVPEETLFELSPGDRVKATIHQYTVVTVEKMSEARSTAMGDRAQSLPH